MILYYIITGIAIFFMAWNFIKAKDKDLNKLMLYAIAMFPLLLRLFRLK